MFSISQTQLSANLFIQNLEERIIWKGHITTKGVWNDFVTGKSIDIAAPSIFEQYDIQG